MPYNNKLYTEGFAGFIDFVWLWYNRISLIIFFVSLVVLLIASIFGVQADTPADTETFVRGTNFRNLNRSRQQLYRVI